jgi:hypothetical protein
VLLEKHEGKRPFRRPGCGWEGNVKLGVVWFYLPQDGGQWQAVVSMAMNVWWYKVQVISLLA